MLSAASLLRLWGASWLGASLLLLSSSLGHSQVPDVADLLMAEPMSLLDWGLYQADGDMDETLDTLNEEMDKERKYFIESGEAYTDDSPFRTFKLRRYGYVYELSYAQYSFENARIELGVYVSLGISTINNPDISHEACADILEDVRLVLMGLSGLALGGFSDDSHRASVARKKLGYWFSHNGYSTPRLGGSYLDDLSRITYIVISMDEYLSDDPKVRCFGLLKGGPVTMQLSPG